MEEVLSRIWCDVLRLARVSTHDNFFELGGDSLLATRVIGRMRAVLGVDTVPRVLFECPTIARLAARLAGSTDKPVAPPLTPAARAPYLPLSFAQQRLWFLDRLQPGDSLYNMTTAVRLRGALDCAALERAFNEIVRRHEVLRSTFRLIDGEPMQVIVPECRLELPVCDLRALADDQREPEVARLVREESERPFDLALGPLLRINLLRTAAHTHVLLVNMHHIVADAWSLTVMFVELRQLYEAYHAGRSPQLPEHALQYADFAVWQRDWLQGEVLEAQLDFWKRQLTDLPSSGLSLDRPRSAVQGSRGATRAFTLPSAVIPALLSIGRQESSTLFMASLTVFLTLLARYSGQYDVAVGSPIAGHNRTEIENLIGFFVNTLVLRVDLSGNPTFRQALRRVRDSCLDAYAHQDLPFERLVETLRPVRDLSRHPLFQVMFALQKAPAQALELEGLSVSPMAVENRTAKFDLTLSLQEGPDGWCGEFEYNIDLFDAGTVRSLADGFVSLLEAVVADPDRPIRQLSCLTPAARAQLLTAWNQTAVDFPADRCLHELFEAQAARSPDAVAVVHGEAQLSYATLNARANQLARRLRELEVGPEVLVALCFERSMDMLVAMLAVLKAGGGYVPLDHGYPQERLRYMLQDCAAPILLTQTPLLERFAPRPAQVICLDSEREALAAFAATNLKPAATAGNAAYVIYTSGSTGLPKGVVVEHRNVVNHNLWAVDAYQLAPSDRVLQFAAVSFDVAVDEIFPTLIGGATLVLWPEDTAPSLEHFQKRIAELAVTVLSLPTAYWHEWVSYLETTQTSLPNTLRLVGVGGERACGEMLQRWQALAAGRVVWLNGYGPTETTVTATMYRPPEDSRAAASGGDPPIGRPIANTRVYILDDAGEPAPVGVAGEMYIGGVGVARGYLKREALTAERFVPDPFSAKTGARLYRTGDLARYRADGEIEFLGGRTTRSRCADTASSPAKWRRCCCGTRRYVRWRWQRAGSSWLPMWCHGRERRQGGVNCAAMLGRRCRNIWCRQSTWSWKPCR